MADPIAVAQKKACAESRLRMVVKRAETEFGVTFREPPVQSRRDQTLSSALFIENVADFLESITSRNKGKT